MGIRLVLIALVSIGISILCTYCYRQKLIKDRLFLAMMMIIGAICVYSGMVVLGVPYDSWGPMILFTLCGTLLGFQGARVIVRITNTERKNAGLRHHGTTE